jgi:hypothetical protein
MPKASRTCALVLLTALASLPLGGCWVILGDPFDGLRGKDAEATGPDAQADGDAFDGPKGKDADATDSDGTLLSDTFDTGNTLDAWPAGWTVSAPTGTTVRIADATSPAPGPHTVPFSVELTDGGASRPSITRTFTASSSGSARVRVFVASGKGPAGIQLRTGSTDHFLCAAIIGNDGNVGYDRGGGTLDSTVAYTAGTWLDVRLDWFDDHTFDAYLGGTKFADRVAFATGADPGRVTLTAGNADTVAAQAYFDTVQVTRLQLADGFDG